MCAYLGPVPNPPLPARRRLALPLVLWTNQMAALLLRHGHVECRGDACLAVEGSSLHAPTTTGHTARRPLAQGPPARRNTLTNVTIQKVRHFYACFGVKMWYHWQNIFNKFLPYPFLAFFNAKTR
jgi:hypothetical protein